jgi:hypothetical protein
LQGALPYFCGHSRLAFIWIQGGLDLLSPMRS